MKKTLVKVISSAMCALLAAMLPMYTAKAAGPRYENVVLENSPRYFYVGEDYYRFELIFEGGLESYSWTYLETQFTVGINVERIESSEINYPDYAYELFTNQEVTNREIYSLGNALAHLTDASLYSETDWNQDGEFGLEDLVFATRKYANNPLNFLIANVFSYERMDIDNFVRLLDYYKEVGETEFVIRPYDTASITTTATETTTTTTSTTTTTTTTAQPTTTTSTTTTTMTTAQPTTTTSKTTTTMTTAQPTTTTSKTTTTMTTAQPTTTTSKITTTMTTAQPTTTTSKTTTTTTTTQPTTTTSKTTTTMTTAQPTTTTSKTTTTTTTAQPTTTTSKTTTTTTTTQPTTTTSKTTTTTTTTQPTTATTTATETTITTSMTIDFTPPTQEDIINPEGFSPSDEEYEGLIETAELFGLDYYKIIWTEELIEYSLVIPSSSYAVGASLEDYRCFQVCPIQDSEKILPEYNWKATGHNLAVWRPEIDGSINFNTCSRDYYWDQQYGFVIIPMKVDEGGALVEDLRLLYPISE